MSSSERPPKRPRRPTPPAYKPQPGETNSSFVNEFFKHHIAIAENDDEDFKHLELPLARIKKVMKSDPDVKMIASEVPVLFSKACEMFISELTTRAWMISDDAKRRTLTKADIASAVERGDMFDFLIDIVPRTQELAPSKSKKREDASTASTAQPPATHPTTHYPQDIHVGHTQDSVDPDIGVYSRENSIPIDEANRLYDPQGLPWQHPFNLPDGSSYLDEIGSSVSFDPSEPADISANSSRHHIVSEQRQNDD